MNRNHSVLFRAQLHGPVLGFDVDWVRGRLVAIVDGSDAIVQLSLGADGLRREPDFGGSMEPPDGRAGTSVALHPTDHVVATAGLDRPIRLWEIEASPHWLRDLGEAKAASPRVRRGFWGASWSTCGAYLDTHSLALDRGERFEVGSGRCVATRWGHDGPFVRHPAADLLAFAMGAEASTVYFARWRGPTAEWLPVAIDLFVPCTLTFAAGSLAAVGGSSCVHAAVFDVPSLRPRFARKLEMVEEEVAAEFGVSQALALAPDGSILYAPGPNGDVVALDGNSGEERARWRPHGQMVTRLAHHPDSGLILSAGLDGCLVLSSVPVPGSARASRAETDALVAQHPPMPGDPESMPRGSVTFIDTPW